MMNAPQEPGIEEVTFMTASRMGKTTVLENIEQHFVENDPSPIMNVLPSDKLAERFSKINLGPMIADNPTMAERMRTMNVRASGDEIALKEFDGGFIILAGANAPTSFGMLYSVRVVLFDEVDGYPPSAGHEGDPVDLGRARAANYQNRLFIYTSTPTIRELSRIEESWNASDQRHYRVPCPFCGHKQILIFHPEHSQFKNLTTGFLSYTYDQRRKIVTKAMYVCSNCRKEIPEKHKPRMLRDGEWVKEKPDVKNHAGFHINRLYSPWTSWKEVALEFVKAEKRREKLIPFINKWLGETFIEKESYQFSGDSLLNRRERYGGVEGPARVPEGVIFLTAGIDTQIDKFIVVIKGWGLNEESWFIERREIKGDPALLSTQQMLDAYLSTAFIHENGFIGRFGKLGGILAVGIDTGGNRTRDVYKYVNAPNRRRLRFYGLKGRPGFGKDFTAQSRTKRSQGPFYLVGVDAGTELVYSRLRIEALTDEKNNPVPTPGRMHFNFRCDKDYFDQLTAKQAKIKRVAGRPVRVYETPGDRQDHAHDCEVYNLAAYDILKAPMEKLAQLMRQQIEKLKANKGASSSSPGSDGSLPPVSDEPTPEPPKPAPPRRRFTIRVGGI